MNEYHKTVLLDEAVDGLSINPNQKQVFVDLTFGGGGHSQLILKKMAKDSKLFAFDQDRQALENKIEDERLILIETNFRFFDKFLRLFDILKVDGIIADLGVSSFQLDESSRGFSYMGNAPLDMRMNPAQDLNAVDILNRYNAGQLQNIFSRYGELRNSAQLARKIVEYRKTHKLEYAEDLVSCIEPVLRGSKYKVLSRIFQAIRIEVNDELGALRDMLVASAKVLKSGGRLSVISFHSLEDRLVKNMIKKGNPEGDVIKDEFGNIQKVFKEVVKGIIVPDKTEIENNPRARSAKLRIAQRL